MIKHLNSKKLTMRVLHVHCLIQILSVAAMKPLHGDHNENNRLSFSADWDTLGPFQIGTRGKKASTPGISACLNFNYMLTLGGRGYLGS